MEKKIKKQRTKLIIRISAILFAVWLILSAAYAVVSLFSEKEQQYHSSKIAFADWQRSLLPYATNPILYIDEARKTALIGGREYDLSGDEVSYSSIGGEISYRYDRDINLMIHSESGNETYDSDDIINILFTAKSEVMEYREQYYGYLSFQKFRASMTDEQYERILYYLDHQPEGIYYYELLCTEFYQSSRDELIPKTLEIVLTRDVHRWYIEDTVVETFALSPLKTERLRLHQISDMQRNVLPEAFIRNDFGSDHLLKTAQKLSDQAAQSTSKDDDTEKHYAGLLTVSAFEYIYYDFNPVFTRVINLMDEPEENADDEKYEPVYSIDLEENDVYYARRFNILDGCRQSILTASGILFVFFLIIGVILTVMMWKSMKTQLIEEHKRREMLSTLAHDIKTPLFILSGYADNLKENIKSDKRDHYAEVIIEQTGEVNRRVGRVLELSRLDSLTLTLDISEFDLSELTGDILKNYEALPDGKRISFIADTKDGGVRIISADRKLIKRAIENLVDNAVKYADSGSEIRIRITDKSFVIENPCGDTLKSNIGGSGFGLQITESVLDLHNLPWKIRAEQNEFAFIIQLP